MSALGRGNSRHRLPRRSRRAPRRRPWQTVAIALALAFAAASLALVLADITLAGTAHDIRGTWTVNGNGCAGSTVAAGPQTWDVTSEDLSSGSFSGTGTAGSTFSLDNGSINGDTIALSTTHGGDTASFTGTISPDSSSMSGTFTDTNGVTNGCWSATGNGTTITSSSSAATTTSSSAATTTTSSTTTTTTTTAAAATTTTATSSTTSTGAPTGCVNNPAPISTCPSSSLLPAVCGPATTLLPQCELPLDLPVVCGGSGAGLKTCGPGNNDVVACGSIGTSLPLCNLPPPQIPNVCGPIGTGLPVCAGANNPITVCGPATGTPLPACSFNTTINATPLNLTSGSGEVDTTVGCPSDDATTSAVRGVHAANGPGGKCVYTFTLDQLQQAKIRALESQLASERDTFLQGVASAWSLDASQFGLTYEQGHKFAVYAFTVFTTRGEALIQANLGRADPLDLPPPPDVQAFINTLGARLGSPNYAGPADLQAAHPVSTEGSQAISDFSNALANAINEYRDLATSINGGGVVKGQGLLQRARLCRFSKTGLSVSARATIAVGKTAKVRLRLPQRALRSLGRCLKGRGALPVRLIVATAAKPMPVVQIFDISLKIKH